MSSIDLRLAPSRGEEEIDACIDPTLREHQLRKDTVLYLERYGAVLGSAFVCHSLEYLGVIIIKNLARLHGSTMMLDGRPVPLVG